MRRYKTVLTEADLSSLRQQVEQAQLVAIDTETTGLDIYQPGFELVGVSLATSAYDGFYIPLAHSDFGGLTYQPEPVPKEEVVELLRYAFARKPTVMHNRSYDRNVLAVTMGINHDETERCEDTKLAAHLQDENYPKGLKELSKRWLGVRESAKQFKLVEPSITALWEAQVWQGEKVNSVNKAGRTYKKTVYRLREDWLEQATAIYLEFAGESAPIGFLFDYMANLFARLKARGLAEYEGVMPKNFRYLPATLATYYAADDAMNTHGLWTVLANGLEIEGLRSLYERIEKPVDDVMTRAEHAGIRMDPQVLREAKALLEERMEKVSSEAMLALSQVLEPDDYIRGNLNPDTLLNSSKQLAYLLYEKFGYPVVERTETGAPSTNRSAIKALLTQQPRLRPDLAGQGETFLKCKQQLDAMKKLVSTYTDSLIAKADPALRVHPSFNVTGTVSGRMSSNNPNYQNMPRLMEEEVAHSPWLQGVDIRRAFVADEGHIFVDADYVSMEMVVCAALSQDENMARLLNEGRDLHCHTARYAFKVGFDLSDEEFKKRYKDYRQKAKIVNFAMIYGGTEYTLQRNFGFTKAEAKAAVQGYFEGFPGVKVWMDAVYRQLEERGYVEYPDYGYVKRMDAVRPANKWDKDAMRQYEAALRSCQNALIQGYSAFIVKDAIVQLRRAFLEEGLKARVAFQVHDEIGVLAPYTEAERVAQLMEAKMTRWLGAVKLGSDIEFKRTMSKNEKSLSLEEVRALAGGT